MPDWIKYPVKTNAEIRKRIEALMPHLAKDPDQPAYAKGNVVLNDAYVACLLEGLKRLERKYKVQDQAPTPDEAPPS